MKLSVTRSSLNGSVVIPGSKSHTVRAVAIASLACGESIIHNPLEASDTRSAVSAFTSLGANIDASKDWTINGVDSHPIPPVHPIDVGNSGTTLYIAMACAALTEGITNFTGDEQICRRPAGPLIEALNSLGAIVESSNGNGCAPLSIRGPMTGGEIVMDCSKTSQYLTALLLACPLSQGHTTIFAERLVEQPYIEMTLDWLKSQNICIKHRDLTRFDIPGGQHYKAFERSVPGDFSSAAFFICGAVLCGSEVVLQGLDPNDTQGDKAIVEMLIEMGADIRWQGTDLVIRGSSLHRTVLDLGDTPDALPALAVTACFATGKTRIVNVAQARLKETDRIAVMASELRKMGADVEEMPDGMIINGGGLHPAVVKGHGDHRIIMALAMAGMALDGETIVEDADAVDVTFPTFASLMKSLGANIQ